MLSMLLLIACCNADIDIIHLITEGIPKCIHTSRESTQQPQQMLCDIQGPLTAAALLDL